MIKWSNEKKWIVAGFSLAALLTSLTSVFSYQNANQLVTSTRKVQQTHTVLNILTDIVALMLDAEAGRRGYIISGDKQELRRYYQSIVNLDGKMKQLQAWTSYNSEQQKKFSSLQALLGQKKHLAQNSISLYQSKPQAREEQNNLLIRNQKIRSEIHLIVQDMQAHEQQLLQKWVEHSQSNIYYRHWIELLSTILSLAILLSTFILLYRQLTKRQEVELLKYKLLQDNELNKLKLHFFSLISHEFRTPLSIILGSSQLLEKTSLNEDKRLKSLRRIQSSARLMSHLLRDILTFARAESGNLDFHTDWLDLQSFCLNLIADLETLNNFKNPINFVSHGFTHAQLDEKLLYSILNNLLANAIKYSPCGQPINFFVDCQTNLVIFRVQDQGVGIPEECLPNIYEPFFRADNVGTNLGTGLGLAVVKKCLEVHGGEIELKTDLGKGSTFTVKIPLKYSSSPPIKPLQTRAYP